MLPDYKVYTLLSPLTQGRELKSSGSPQRIHACPSPLTQGRELKYHHIQDMIEAAACRPSRRGEN